MIKRFGLADVFAGMVVLACLGIAGCSEDDKDSHVHDYSVVVGHKDADCTEAGYDLKKCSVCGDEKKDNIVSAKGHDYGDWVVDQVADKDHIGKKHHVCNSCGNSESVDDASEFFSHKDYDNLILDKDGFLRVDINRNGIDDDYWDRINPETGEPFNKVENSNEECQLNKKARDPNNKYYGKKHAHITVDDKKIVQWDMNDNGNFDDEEDEIEGPFKAKNVLGEIK